MNCNFKDGNSCDIKQSYKSECDGEDSCILMEQLKPECNCFEMCDAAPYTFGIFHVSPDSLAFICPKHGYKKR